MSGPLKTPPGEQLKALAGGLAMLIGTLITALVTSGIQVEPWMVGLIVLVSAVMAWLVVFYVPNRNGDVPPEDDWEPLSERLAKERAEQRRLARMTPAEAMAEAEKRRLTEDLPPERDLGETGAGPPYDPPR